MFNAALRAAVEHYAGHITAPHTDPATARTELATALRSALAAVGQGLV